MKYVPHYIYWEIYTNSWQNDYTNMQSSGCDVSVLILSYSPSDTLNNYAFQTLFWYLKVVTLKKICALHYLHFTIFIAPGAA